MPAATVRAVDAEPLGDVRCAVGESPLWSPAEQALHWVDIEGRRIHRRAWAGGPSGAARAWTLPERIGSIAPHAAGGLVAALQTGIVHARLPDDGDDARDAVLAPIAAAALPRAGMRFNDGRCDRAGRFWVTSMVMDMALASPAGALHRLDGRGLRPAGVDGLVTGNGLAFSPDGRTMYLSDSHPSVRRIWAFDLDADGTPSRRREFVDMRAHPPGRPDGAAVDAEGFYWTCANDAGQVLRFAPDGRLDRRLALPVSKPSMCAFGGAALDVLFVASIVPARPADGFDASLDGAVLALHPGAGVRGLPETPFAAA